MSTSLRSYPCSSLAINSISPSNFLNYFRPCLDANKKLDCESFRYHFLRKSAYPYLRILAGSTLLARRAGIKQASNVPAISSSAAQVNVTGSVGPIP